MKESGQELKREWGNSILEYLEEEKGRAECCNYIIISNIKKNLGSSLSNFLKLPEKPVGFLGRYSIGTAFRYFGPF